jgi:hypothetical protein
MAWPNSKAMAKIKRSRSGRVVWWFWPVLIGALLLLLASVTLLFGGVSGIELSQQDLTARKFSYRQLPLVRIQISPVYREPIFSAASSVNIAQHLKPLARGKTIQWDLVEFSEANRSHPPADAAILYRILELKNTNNEFLWDAWSTKFPNRAAEMWPAIQDLAQCRLYWVTPKVMELYRSGSTDSTLIPERNEILSSAAKLAIEDFAAAGQYEAARNVFQTLRRYDDFEELNGLDQLWEGKIPSANNDKTSASQPDDLPDSKSNQPPAAKETDDKQDTPSDQSTSDLEGKTQLFRQQKHTFVSPAFIYLRACYL